MLTQSSKRHLIKIIGGGGLINLTSHKTMSLTYFIACPSLIAPGFSFAMAPAAIHS